MGPHEESNRGPRDVDLWVGALLSLPILLIVPSMALGLAVQMELVAEPQTWTDRQRTSYAIPSQMVGYVAFLLFARALNVRVGFGSDSSLSTLGRYVAFVVPWLGLMCGYLWLSRQAGHEIAMQDALEYNLTPEPTSFLWWMGVVAIVVVGPLVEEMVFRGLVQQLIKRYFDAMSAVVLTAIFFGLIHGVDYAFPLAVVGLFFGWLRERSGNLWAPTLAHMTHNALMLVLAIFLPDFMRVIYGGSS